MKVVKLDKRHREYHNGFTHALRFAPNDPNYCAIYDYFTSMYPRDYDTRRRGWFHEKWASVSSKHPWPSQVHWVCVKNEAFLTIAILTVDHIQ